MAKIVTGLSIFERYLTVWVLLCIAGGIFLGKTAPDVATALNDLSVHQVSIPIAVCLFFMVRASHLGLPCTYLRMRSGLSIARSSPII